MAVELKEWINSITFTKEDLSEHINEYPSFVVNRIIGSDISCVALVNEINKRPSMSPEMQYKFLLLTIPKRKRFNPYLKKIKEKDLEYIKEYFNISNEKAKEYLAVLDVEQVQSIKRQLYKGGTS